MDLEFLNIIAKLTTHSDNLDMNEEDAMKQTMSSLSSKYAEAKTWVFWDMEDCPIPEGLNPDSVHRNIRSALANKGYRGEVKISAYGDKNQIPGYFESAGISLIPAGDKYARSRRMRLDFWSSTLENRVDTLSNMMVISRDNTDFSSFLGVWEGTNRNILLAQPQNAPARCCNCGVTTITAGAEWFWESLAAGGDAIIVPREPCNQDT